MDEEDVLVILLTDRTPYEIQTNSLLIPAPLRFPRTRPIRLFPLRRWIVDLPGLFQHALDVECAALARERLSWSDDVSRFLREHSWPGNLHELHRRARDGTRSATSNILRLEDLLEPHSHAARSDRLDELVRVHTLRVYEDCGGDVRLAAERLGLAASRLYSRLQEYGLARRQKQDAS